MITAVLKLQPAHVKTCTDMIFTLSSRT